MYTSCPVCGTIVDVPTDVLGSRDGAAYCEVCQDSFSALKNLAQDASDARPSASAANAPSKKRRRGKRGGKRRKTGATTPPETDAPPPDSSEPTAAAASEAAAPAAAAPPARNAALRLVVGLLFGLVLLGGLHANRETLADAPVVGPAVIATYAAIGRPLAPRWQLNAYAIRGSSAVSSARGKLQVQALIENTATVAQAPPLLRVVLQDAFGAMVGHRDFTPADYLPPPVPARMAPASRLNAVASLTDVPNAAVGFELDICLEAAGQLRCQTDTPAPRRP